MMDLLIKINKTWMVILIPALGISAILDSKFFGGSLSRYLWLNLWEFLIFFIGYNMGFLTLKRAVDNKAVKIEPVINTFSE